jgi:hypothetical protein
VFHKIGSLEEAVAATHDWLVSVGFKDDYASYRVSQIDGGLEGGFSEGQN